MRRIPSTALLLLVISAAAEPRNTRKHERAYRTINAELAESAENVVVPFSLALNVSPGAAPGVS